MKTLIGLSTALILTSAALAEPASAQVRERVIEVSTVTVSGPPTPRQAPFFRPGPPPKIQSRHRHGPPPHARAPHRTVRPDPHREQARMANWYARQAVAQAREGRRLGCASDHPRWSTSFQGHYRWAYGATRQQAIREIERRDQALARCWAYR